MATEPTIFVFANAEIRVVMLDDAPHFVGKDVAERLGYADPAGAIAKHCKGSPKRHPLSTQGGMQEVRVLSEPDVLRLIVRSKLSEAQQFERWVFEEVLPSIRKSGGYMVAAPDETPEEIMLRALTIAKETVDRQKAQLAIAQPKADAMDLMEAATSKPMGVRDAGRHLQIGQNEVVRLALDWGWACRESRKLKSTHYGREHEYTVMTPRTYVREGEDFVDLEFKLTRKGVDRMAIKIAKAKASRPRMEPGMSDTIGLVRH